MQIDIRTNQSRINQPLFCLVLPPAEGDRKGSTDLKTEQSR
jgi:hypothetical protein